MGRVTTHRPVLRISTSGTQRCPDSLVVEEPLDLRVDGHALTVTMRTPGHDVELAHGFLLTEGVIGAATDIHTARYCGSVDDQGRNTYNVLDVALAPGVPAPAAGVHRSFYTTSSCGICGKASLEAVRLQTRFPPRDDPVRLDAEVLAGLPDALRSAQRVFASTGGLHAAGLFDATGALRAAREDVGRHNAVDKVIGHALMQGRVPLTGGILLVSGRASFEITQKAVLAGLPVLAAVSAPSSLAVDLAEEAGMTLIGFLRGPSMNVYTGSHRIRMPSLSASHVG